MDEEKESPAQENWRDPDQPGRPLIPQLREHRGFVLSAFALAFVVGIIFIEVRPFSGRAPNSIVASSPSPPGFPFFGLYPGLAYDPAHLSGRALQSPWRNLALVRKPLDGCAGAGEPARPRECSDGVGPKTGSGAPVWRFGGAT